MYKHARESLRSPLPVPDKLFYKIGEVSKITGVEQYVLRYWETEFYFLRPRKNKSGQRVYVKKDIELVLQLKRMLYDERYTIEGVRKRFEEGLFGVVEKKTTPEVQAPEEPVPTDLLGFVKSRLRNILSRIQ